MQDLYDAISKLGISTFEAKEKDFGEENTRFLERNVLLETIDQLWKDHLAQMDHLKEGIGLRGYAQKDPLLEYKKEAFNLFDRMKYSVKYAAVQRFLGVQLVSEEELRRKEEMMRRHADEGIELSGGEDVDAGSQSASEMLKREAQKAKVEGMRKELDTVNERFKQLTQTSHGSLPEDEGAAAPVKNEFKGVGRNDPCPCGSGKKFKKCHGA